MANYSECYCGCCAFSKKRRRDYMNDVSIVANNFKQNELNEMNESHGYRYYGDDSDCDYGGPACNIVKAKKQNARLNYDMGDVTLQGKKLMLDYTDDDEYALEYSDTPSSSAAAKGVYDVPPSQSKYASSRRNSRASLHKQALQRQKSGDRFLDGPAAILPPPEATCMDCGSSRTTKKRRPQSQRDLRSKRNRSGHHLNAAAMAAAHNRSAVQSPCDVPVYGFPRQLTQSAPDLLLLECPAVGWAISPDEPYATQPYHIPSAAHAQTPTAASVQSTPHHATYAPNDDPRRATVPNAKRKLNMTYDNI